MKLRKVFLTTVGLLAGALLLQVASIIHEKPQPRYFATWKNTPKNMAEAKSLADQIVLGRVTRVRRADDLVIGAPGEPEGQDRIPIEVVTIKLEKSYKGAKPETIELFHTGLSVGVPPSERRRPPGPPPERPEGAIERPAAERVPGKLESRTIFLEDDDEYEQGGRYFLLTVDGPEVRVDGVPVRTKALISPEGRYRVKADNRIEPATKRGFAGTRAGKRLQELEAELE